MTSALLHGSQRRGHQGLAVEKQCTREAGSAGRRAIASNIALHLRFLCLPDAAGCLLKILCIKASMLGEEQQCRLTWQVSNKCWVRGLQA